MYNILIIINMIRKIIDYLINFHFYLFMAFLVGFVGFLEKMDLVVDHKDQVNGTCSHILIILIA